MNNHANYEFTILSAYFFILLKLLTKGMVLERNLKVTVQETMRNQIKLKFNILRYLKIKYIEISEHHDKFVKSRSQYPHKHKSVSDKTCVSHSKHLSLKNCTEIIYYPHMQIQNCSGLTASIYSILNMNMIHVHRRSSTTIIFIQLSTRDHLKLFITRLRRLFITVY